MVTDTRTSEKRYSFYKQNVNFVLYGTFILCRHKRKGPTVKRSIVTFCSVLWRTYKTWYGNFRVLNSWTWKRSFGSIHSGKIPQHLPNVLEKLSEVGHIAMKFETARIHFLRAEVQLAASLSINTLRKLHRRARTLVIIPEKVWVSAFLRGGGGGAERRDLRPYKKWIRAIIWFQTSSLHVPPRSISPIHLAYVGEFFQSGLKQSVTVSKFRNLEYENVRIMFYTSFRLAKLEE